jgi:hypothetical protein
MRLSLRLTIPLASLVATAAAYTGYWFYEAGVVRDGLAAWTEARRAEGYTVAYDPPTVSGFPRQLRLRLDHPSIEAAGKAWRWTGDSTVAEARPWAIRRVAVHPIGRQEISFPAGGGPGTIVASAAQSTLLVDANEHGRLGSASLDAEGVTITVATAPGPFGAQHLHLDLAANTNGGQASETKSPQLPPSWSFALNLQDLTLPQAAGGALGPQVRWFTIKAQLLGTVDGPTPFQAFAAWRDSGGTAELQSFSLAWGPLQISGNATLALDPAMQPEGAGTAQIRGFAETIDALIAERLVKPDAGTIAKAALGLIAKTPPEGGPKVLTAPLTIEKQTLYAGPIGLLKIPPIRWAR